MTAPTRRNGLALLLALLLSLCSGLCAADCGVNSPAVSLGTASSLTLATVPQQAAASGGLACDGVLAALTAAYVRVTLNSPTMVLSDGKGNQIPFQVYADAAYSQALQNGQPQVLSSLALVGLGTSQSAVALYFRTQAGANVPAGTYTATVTLNWQWAICTTGALNLCVWQRSPGLTQTCNLGICGSPTNWGTGSQAVVTLTLVVTKACLISSLPQVDFGAKALANQFGTVTQTLAVICTNTEGYTVGFDNGQNYAAPWRRMAFSGNYLNYQIYFPGTTTVWTTSQTQSAVGNGALQTFNFQVTVDPTQPNKPAGIYLDNVTVIINY
ncbi:Csu type fimbrial protein [Pseudomonas mangiferae]|uniref:Spore coat U domain-containing protein n=1 Tax=Pseudomonas mangiferae TaxID=2593654 RepID=A0A553GXK1_9PSED|nr:spore coat protein U domain-containing protein [Pseudomonas mangiferae]TRX74234.1 spore coat U domain-containing protein [Pseudomonas mangiferae]